jgi:hypothetical protein
VQSRTAANAVGGAETVREGESARRDAGGDWSLERTASTAATAISAATAATTILVDHIGNLHAVELRRLACSSCDPNATRSISLPALCGSSPDPLLPGRETCPCSESGRWLCRDTPTSEWRRCEHWAIDAVLEQRRDRAAGHR